MPAATVTLRQLKNQETGIDITVPAYDEIPGLITKSVEFQITVVTNLAIFKSPKHKESDVVQFVIGKKFSDFEDVYLALNEKFSGIAFPTLPKKVLFATDDVISERRASLERLMKFCSKTPRVSNSYALLEFLGAPANKLQKLETLFIVDDSRDHVDSSPKVNKEEIKSPSDEPDIFGENEEEHQELFSEMKTERRNTESDLFDESPGDKPAYDVKLFAEQEFDGGAIFKDDELTRLGGVDEMDFPVKKKINPATDELLKVEDDLDQLLKITKKPRKPVPTPRAHLTLSSKREVTKKAAVAPKKASPVLPTSADDIMKYIEENTDRDDVDLFS